MAKYLKIEDMVSIDKQGDVVLWWSRHSKTTLGGGVIIPKSEVPQDEMVDLLRRALKLAVELNMEEQARTASGWLQKE